MSEPVAERILANIKTRLLDYTSDTQRSTRVTTWQPKDGTIVINMGEITKNEELSCHGNPPAQAWDMVVEICTLLKPSDQDTVAIDTYKNRAWAEVIKACCDGIARWHTWGELAINSKIGTVSEHTDGDGAFAGIKVEMMVTFRTDEDNPYNVRA